MAFNWTCPYCNTKTTITGDRYKTESTQLTTKNADGFRHLKLEWIICPNDDCHRLTINAILSELIDAPSTWDIGKLIKKYRLVPDNNAKIFPTYIPKQLIQDYNEAYAILELSPKASATLSRRCLQGIIRDFWGVSKARLVDEINAIEDKVDPLTWKSIDAIRKVGNIGAHMEKDINLVIDVDPQEAFLLIQLIELLFEEWYIHRHEREEKLKAIVGVAIKKENAKK